MTTPVLALAEVSPPDDSADPLFSAVGVWKLVLLSVCTLGLYHLFWFFRNWQLVRYRTPIDAVGPYWRTLFALFFCHGLFARMRDEARRTGVAPPPSPAALTALYVLLAGVAPQLPGGYALVSLASVAPLALAQRSVNALNARARPAADPNMRLSVWNWVVVGLGCLVILLAAVDVLLPDAS